MSTLLFTGQTDVGRHRRENQDSFISKSLWSEETALLVAIDGVGGYTGGERAAVLARESIERYMHTPTGDTLTMLREAVVYANNQIVEESRQNPRLAQMCCVLTAAVADVQARKVVYVHVGDTRMYRFRAGQLEKITRDHSLVGVREDAHQLTEAEAMNHPRRNEVLRTVGTEMHRVDDPEFLESGEIDFLPGDHLLLCSDGLTDMLPRVSLTAVLSQPTSLEEQITELIRQANEQGGHDNITVVLARNNAKADTKTKGRKAAPINDQSAPVEPPAPLLSQTRSASDGPDRPEMKAFPKKNWGLWAGLVALAGIIGGLFWYQSREAGEAAPADTNQTTDTAASRSDRPVPEPALADSGATDTSISLNALLRQAWQSPDHQLVWPTDTLRLSEPLLLTDSLRAVVGANPSRPVVVVAADTLRDEPAFRIVEIKNARLENLVFSRYRTAIETDNADELQLRNVVFSGVGLPIRAAIRRDTFRNATVRIMIQNQTDLPRKP